MPSENGWEPARASSEQCEWVTVPGTDVNLQLLKGQPSTLLRAWAADWNAYIEPLRDPDSAGWTPTNAVATSNHLNGTAVDLNWNSHPFRNRGSLNADQMRTLAEMEEFYEGTVFWAGRWDDPVDEMHSQMGYNSYGNPHTQDVINRKIRSDGFSTFQRGDTPPPPPPLSQKDRYALAIIEEGRKRNVSRKGICIALSVPFVESGYRMYANSNVPESLNYPHEAIGSDHDSTGLFQQRQAWGPLSCTMDAACSAGLFFDGGAQGQRGLTDFDYNSDVRTPGGWAQAVQVSAFPDRYDEHWDEAVVLYDRLATAPIDDWEELLANPELERMIREIHHALYELVPSKSRYGDPSITWYRKDLPWNNDGFWYDVITEHDAALGDEAALRRIQHAAAAGDGKAAAYLARLTAPPTTAAAPPPPATTPPAPQPIPPPQPTTPRIEYIPVPYQPEKAEGKNGDHSATTGELIGRLFSALEALKLADSMSIEARAPMAALVKILESKAGLT